MKKKISRRVPTAISLTAARTQLFSLTDAVAASGKAITLTEHGEPKAVLISVGDFERLAESVQRDSHPKLSRYERLAKSLADAGFILAEKSSRPYDASSKPSLKSLSKTSIV